MLKVKVEPVWLWKVKLDIYLGTEVVFFIFFTWSTGSTTGSTRASRVSRPGLTRVTQNPAGLTGSSGFENPGFFTFFLVGTGRTG